MRSISRVFRKHPEFTAAGKLSLLGKSRCNAEVMNAYLRRRNPRAPEVAELYLRQGQRYGIRGDAAYCQMVYETRGWTAPISGPYWAPLTLDQWGMEESVEGLMRTLYTFATDLPLPQALEESADLWSKQSEMLVRAGWRGIAPCWEDLNGKWTRTGRHYGQDIVAIWRSMLEWEGKGEAIPTEEDSTMENSYKEGSSSSTRSAREGSQVSLDWSSSCTEEMNWLRDQGVLPSPAPHPERKVSWAELAALLQRLEARTSPATIKGNEDSLNE